MRRREFIFLLGGAAAIPHAALAQQTERVRHIGVLIGVDNNAEGQARLAAFRNGMHDLGWSEGQNIQLDVRFTGGIADRARADAAELIKSAPDVILANTSIVVAALRNQTTTITRRMSAIGTKQTFH
jgi:putative ABC transport system substrate-binding protein